MSDPTNHLNHNGPRNNTEKSADTDPNSVVDPHWRSSTRARLVAAAGLAALAAAVTASIVATSNSTPPRHDDASPLGANATGPSWDGAPSLSTGSSTSVTTTTPGRAATATGQGPTPTRARTTTAPGQAPGQPAPGTTAARRRSTLSAPHPSQHSTSHQPTQPRHRTTSPKPSKSKPSKRRSTPPAPAPFHAHWVYVAGPSAFTGHKIGSYSSQLARSCADSSDLSACNTSGVQWGGGCSNLYYGATVPDGAPVGWAVWEFAAGQCKYAMSAGNPGGD